MHLAQEFQPACKTKVHPRRTCKSVSVQVDQRVYFLLPGIEPASTRRRTAKGDSVYFGIFIYLLFLKLQIHMFIATILIHLICPDVDKLPGTYTNDLLRRSRRAPLGLDYCRIIMKYLQWGLS